MNEKGQFITQKERDTNANLPIADDLGYGPYVPDAENDQILLSSIHQGFEFRIDAYPKMEAGQKVYWRIVYESIGLFAGTHVIADGTVGAGFWLHHPGTTDPKIRNGTKVTFDFNVMRNGTEERSLGRKYTVSNGIK